MNIRNEQTEVNGIQQESSFTVIDSKKFFIH